MTEQEYIDAGDRKSLSTIFDILRDLDCSEDPNKMRARSIKENIKLMVADIDSRIKLE